MFLHVCVCSHGRRRSTWSDTPPGPGTPPRQVYPPDQVHPLDQVHPPDWVHPGTLDQVHPPGPVTPPRPGAPPLDRVHPLDQVHPHPWTKYHPLPGTLPSRSSAYWEIWATSGGYASYWNASLFNINLLADPRDSSRDTPSLSPISFTFFLQFLGEN